MNYPHINKPKETVDTLVSGGQKIVNAALSVVVSIIVTGVIIILATLLA